jgi:hypothetical protein
VSNIQFMVGLAAVVACTSLAGGAAGGLLVWWLTVRPARHRFVRDVEAHVREHGGRRS